MSAKQLWEGSYRQQAQDVITERLAARQPAGWTANHDHTFRMRALQAWSKGKLKGDGTVMKTLTRMKERGLTTVEDFEEMRAELRAEWAREANQKTTQWEFFVPLVLKLADDLPRPSSIIVSGKTFILNTWKAVEAALDKDSIKSALDKEYVKVDQSPDACLSFTAEGVEPEHAWNMEGSTFDLFRGLLEFMHGFTRWSYRIGEPSSRSTFPLPQWLLARNPSRGLEVLRFTTTPRAGTVQPLTKRMFEGLVKTAGRFKDSAEGTSTKALLADSLRLYAQALDEKLHHTCLLSLWQMAETLTLSNRFNGETKVVCARLVALVTKQWQPEFKGLAEILKEIAEKRNRIVHHGVYDTVDDDDINILKLICELALWSVMETADKLPTQDHLNHFYGLYGRAETELQAIEQTLSCVNELEKKRKEGSKTAQS